MTALHRERLLETLRELETVMVATNADNGTIHARPMAIAEVDDSGEIWFLTRKESGKVEEVLRDARAVVTGQAADRYVSISGTLDVIHDPERVHTLYRPEFDVWFEDGPRDANLVLIRLRPELGELWLGGRLEGIRYLFEATRALLHDTVPRDSTIEHAKFPL